MDFAQEGAASASILGSKAYAINSASQQVTITQQLTDTLNRTMRLLNEVNSQIARLREGDQPQPLRETGLMSGIDASPQRGLPDLAMQASEIANRVEDVISQLRTL